MVFWVILIFCFKILAWIEKEKQNLARSIPQTVSGPEPDRDCGPLKRCVSKDMCPPYLSLNSLVRQLDSSQDSRRVLIDQLKSTICNEASRKVCCDEDEIPEWPQTGG